jgi:hypothetical protein
MTEHEYKFLKNKWEDVRGAAFNQVGEFCYEFGWIDDFGLVTPQGQKAVEEYERQNPISRY